MKDLLFRNWLSEIVAPVGVPTIVACARRVEDAYGPLDDHYDQDRFEKLFEYLRYTSSDQKALKQNLTKITINGNVYNGLASLRSGIRYYRDFRNAELSESVPSLAVIEQASKIVTENKEGRQFDFEVTLQKFLRLEIGQLEAGLEVADEGAERRVESGAIDILARDANGALVVIELKRTMAKKDAVGQILGYMGDLKIEEPETTIRGIIVAADFDKACRSAVTIVPTLSLRKYGVRFSFENL